MKVYTYSEARQGSPLDVPAVKANLRPGELGDLIREGCESANRFWDERLRSRRKQLAGPKPRRRAP